MDQFLPKNQGKHRNTCSSGETKKYIRYFVVYSSCVDFFLLLCWPPVGALERPPKGVEWRRKSKERQYTQHTYSMCACDNVTTRVTKTAYSMWACDNINNKGDNNRVISL